MWDKVENWFGQGFVSFFSAVLNWADPILFYGLQIVSMCFFLAWLFTGDEHEKIIPIKCVIIYFFFKVVMIGL